MSLTQSLAEFVVKTTFKDFPKEVIEHSKLCILDWLGSALAGSQEPAAKIVRSVVERLGGVPESSIIGSSLKTSCAYAALANGVSGHVVELDDIHQESIIHPAAPVLPAALAIGEREGVSGRDLITAVVIGYEIEVRIGKVANPSYYKFWHATGTIGTFGAVASAGKLLNLDEKSMVHAFGIAGTMTAGLIEVIGTMSKPLNPGRAAMNGVLAALLAKEGFTSSTRILEAEKGYLRVLAREYDVNEIVEALGKHFKILNNIFKVHASCGHTHAAIDAVLEITKRYNVKPEDVEEVLVGTYPIAIEIVGKNYEPSTPSEAKFSLPYCVAVALIYNRVGLREFSYEKLEDPMIRTLARKVKIFVEPECADAKLGCAKVRIRTKSGGEYSSFVTAPRGYPQNPLSKQELEEKFKSLALLVLTENRVVEILKVTESLEEVDNIETLMRLVRV